MLEELTKIATGFKDGFLHFIPKLIIASVVLGIGYLIARLVKFLVMRLVNQTSKLISKRIANIRLGEYAPLMGTTFFWIILLSTFLLITDILGLTLITDWVDSILKYTPNLIAAILIILVAVVLGKFTSDFISSAGKQLGLQYVVTLGTVAQYFIVITAIIVAIDQIGIEITFLTTLINIILALLLFGGALAFGIGAKTSVSNILANFYVRKMYKVGDLVKIGDVEGTISKIDNTIVVLDNESGQVSIPAKAFIETSSVLIKKK